MRGSLEEFIDQEGLSFERIENLIHESRPSNLTGFRANNDMYFEGFGSFFIWVDTLEGGLFWGNISEKWTTYKRDLKGVTYFKAHGLKHLRKEDQGFNPDLI